MFASRLKSDDRGAALVMVALLGTALVLTGMLVMTRATSSVVRTQGDRLTEEAAFVAESAADQGIARLNADATFSTVSDATDLSDKAAVIAAADALVALDPTALQRTSDGDFVVIKAPSSDTVYGVGFSPDIDSATRRERVIEVKTITTTAAAGCWPDGAIIGSGLVESGGFNLNTIPANDHTASIIGNFDFKGSSGGFIDGDVWMVGNVNNQPPENVHGTIESGMSPPLGFPDDAALTAWENDLIAQAQAGGTISGIDLSTSMTINAPVYINGNVQLHSGAILTITGPGVVYVNGFFELGGDSEVYNGALLAVRDFFKQGGGTNYEITGSPSDAGLVSFYENTDAIEFEGSVDGNLFGVVYAARGGLKIANANDLEGGFIAGGIGTNGQAKFSGGATINYPSGLMPSVLWLPDITGGPGGGCSAGGGGGTWSEGAVISNGDVRLSGGLVYTNPADGHFANVIANGNADYSGSAWVDGDSIAAGVADTGYSYGTTTSGAPAAWFPPVIDIMDWQTQLIADAQVGGTMPSASYGSDTTLNTPLYVNGDLTMSGATLTLTGNGVLYVNGKLTLSGGATLDNDGVVAAGGVIKFSGGSEYKISGVSSQTAVIGFAFNSKALELSGGSSGFSQGVAYAPNGGILLSGGGAWHGGLLAGGVGSFAKVELSGSSSVNYPNGLISGSQVIPQGTPPPVVGGTITLVSRHEL